MSKIELIGIAGYEGAKLVADLSFYILKNTRYNTALVFDDLIMINDSFFKEGTIKNDDMRNFLSFIKDKIDFLIFYLLDKDKLRTIINEFNKIDTLIDTVNKEDYIKNSDINEIKNILYKNVKKNGVVIINSDIKGESNIFKHLQERVVITYGLSSRSTITASSVPMHDEFSLICCLQRGLTTIDGKDIEPLEFPVKMYLDDSFDVHNILPVLAKSLRYGISIENIQELLSKYRYKSY